ncbi:hypothetical protein Tcan_09393 [Toxocara canis]|uniref:Uncharacterized protein n=1 Tax=Toxocara canis TaxID=6265 RepID=A0A0B2URZ2_TOXCA|nr:hypothetical protein Tcan_09393 [Toxocara canis]
MNVCFGLPSQFFETVDLIGQIAETLISATLETIRTFFELYQPLSNNLSLITDQMKALQQGASTESDDWSFN